MLPQNDATWQQVLQGVRRYRDKHQLNWRIVTTLESEPHKWPSEATWIVGRSAMAARVAKLSHGPRAVCLFGRRYPQRLISCKIDEASIGRAAAHYLYDQGVRRIGVYGYAASFAQRIRQLETAAKACGMTVDIFNPSKERVPERFDQSLVDWMKQRLPHLSMYCPIDSHAQWLLELCHRFGVGVPSEVTILGTGNYFTSCHADEPFLSSVSFPWQRIGASAARRAHVLVQEPMRDDLMEPDLISVYRVHERGSTISHVPSESGAEVTIPFKQWLADHVHHPQPLAGLQQEFHLSSATILRQFKKYYATTPKQYQLRLRLKQACQLLNSSRDSIETIALQAGFINRLTFTKAFKRQYGMTPTEFKKYNSDQ